MQEFGKSALLSAMSAASAQQIGCKPSHELKARPSQAPSSSLSSAQKTSRTLQRLSRLRDARLKREHQLRAFSCESEPQKSEMLPALSFLIFDATTCVFVLLMCMFCLDWDAPAPVESQTHVPHKSTLALIHQIDEGRRKGDSWNQHRNYVSSIHEANSPPIQGVAKSLARSMTMRASIKPSESSIRTVKDTATAGRVPQTFGHLTYLQPPSTRPPPPPGSSGRLQKDVSLQHSLCGSGDHSAGFGSRGSIHGMSPAGSLPNIGRGSVTHSGLHRRELVDRISSNQALNNLGEMAQEIRISLQYQREYETVLLEARRTVDREIAQENLRRVEQEKAWKLGGPGVPSAEMQESIRSGRSEADQLIAERAHRLFKGIKSNFELKLVYARRAAQNIVADDADLEELKELIRRTNNIADFTFLDDQELESASIHPVPFETYSAQKQGYRGSGSDLRSHTSLSRRNDSSFNLANSQRGHSGSHRSFIRRTAQRSSEFVYDDSAPLLGRPAISTTSIPASDANEPIPDSARTFIEKEFKNVSPGHDAETAKGTEVTPVTGSTLNNQSESDTHASEGHPDAVELSVNDDAPQSAVEEFTKVIEIPPTEEPSEDLKANEPQALPKLHVDVTVVSPESESAFTNIVFTTVDAQTSPGLPIDFDAKLADVLRKIKAPTSILKDTVNRAITTLFEENCITTASATTLPTLQQPQQNVLRRLFRPRQRVVRAPAVQVGNWGDSKPDFKFTSSSVYGGSIDEIMARDDVTTELHGVRFPTVLVDAMAILRTCGLRTKGLFRQSGGAEMVDEMISKINSGQPWSFNPNTPLLTADCIKRFYRMSREPVMTHALYETFHSVADLPTKEAQLRGLQLLVASIPKTNQQLLALFLSFCQEVLGQPLNLMSPYALAVCMGPNLLREGEFDLTGDGGAERLSRARARYAKGVAIIQLCIQDFEHLWDLPSEIAELVRLAEETGSQTSYPGLQFPGVQKRDVGKANVSSWGIHHTSVGTASPQVMSATTSTPHSPVRQVLAVATGAHGARPHGGRRFMRTLFRRRKSL